MTNPTTRDILGFPIVPPAPITQGVVRLRRLLGLAQRRTAPPAIRVLEVMFGLFDNRVLSLIVELDIPELLGHRMALNELAAATGTEADGLERVLRYGVGRGFLAQDRKGRYRANDMTAVLRADHPNSWRGWVEFAGSDWFWQAWRQLDGCVRERRSGVELGLGHSFFDYVNRINPEAGSAFNSAMAAGGSLQGLCLAHGLDWNDVRTVCDVGGGTGATLEYLLGANPSLTGVVFDLPEVISQLRPRLLTGDLAGRCSAVSGSFFEGVPPAFDRYLLLAIVHDWSDDEAVTLLSNVAAALRPGARAIVVESVLADRPNGDFAEASHLLMRVLATGRERTDAELQRLFDRAGLALRQQVVLASGFVAFVLAA